MIILNPYCRKKLNGYYKKIMRTTDYIRALFSEPKYRSVDVSCIDMSYLPNKKRTSDVIAENTPITILLKPTESLFKRRNKINQYFKSNGFHIEEEFTVTNFSDLIDTLYFGAHYIARYVVALYKNDSILKQRLGTVVIVKHEKKIDLIKLKNAIRCITGFDFYLINVSGNNNFIGLNTIHIPDSENMEKETKIIRGYRNE